MKQGRFEILPDDPAPVEPVRKGRFEILPDEPPKAPSQAYSGSILPFSVDASGKASFDSNAGLLGVAKRALTLPGQVMKGEVDPMSDEGIGRAFEAATVMTPVSPALRAGGRVAGGGPVAPGKGQWETTTSPAKPPAPSSEALYQAADQGYNRVRDMAVDYSGKSVQDLARAQRQALEADGILENLAPKTFQILKQLESAPDGSVAPLAGLEAARRALGHAGRDFANPTEQLASSRLVGGMDDFIRAANPGDVVAGDAQMAAKTISDARGNYAAAKRSDKLTGAEDVADLNAAVANSGTNSDNQIRQRVASLLKSPKQSAGFTEDELTLLREVAEGKAATNITRFVGNLLGGGGGLGAVASGSAGGGVGALIGGPAGAAVGATVPAIGIGLRRAASNMTRKGLQSVDEVTRMRSPLYEQLQAAAPDLVVSPEKRMALIRALMESIAATDQVPDPATGR